MKYQELKNLVNDFEKYKKALKLLQELDKSIKLYVESEKYSFCSNPIGIIDIGNEPLLSSFIYSYFNTKVDNLRKQIYNIKFEEEK